MKPGATMMSSFLVNTAIILTMAPAVLQFCAQAFAVYGDQTSIFDIFGNQFCARAYAVYGDQTSIFGNQAFAVNGNQASIFDIFDNQASSVYGDQTSIFDIFSNQVGCVLAFAVYGNQTFTFDIFGNQVQSLMGISYIYNLNIFLYLMGDAAMIIATETSSERILWNEDYPYLLATVVASWFLAGLLVGDYRGRPPTSDNLTLLLLGGAPIIALVDSTITWAISMVISIAIFSVLIDQVLIDSAPLLDDILSEDSSPQVEPQSGAQSILSRGPSDLELRHDSRDDSVAWTESTLSKLTAGYRYAARALHNSKPRSTGTLLGKKVYNSPRDWRSNNFKLEG
eukprot:gene25464-11123_t